MRVSLPRLSGLAEPAKYDALVERFPDIWWGDEGPFVGLHQLNTARVGYFRTAIGSFGGRRVLDLGCGGGILAEALAREGARVSGLDPSPRSVVAAREHAARAGLAIDYRVGTAEELPGAGFTEHFDSVFAVDVLEHVDDLDRALAAIATVLGPGGSFGFLTHNRTPAAFLRLIWDEEYVHQTMPEGFHDFARFVAPAELAEAMARRGLVVQEMRGLTRAPDGTRVLGDDLTVTYVGWALRTR